MNWLKAHYNKIASAVLAFVTLLAMAPYDLGVVSMVFPDSWKPWVFIFGAIATCVTRLGGSKRSGSSRDGPTTQNFSTYNFPSK